MIYLLYWLASGVVGWVGLCFYRIWQDDWPYNEPLSSWARGFALALALGPLLILFVMYIEYEERHREKEHERNRCD